MGLPLRVTRAGLAASSSDPELESLEGAGWVLALRLRRRAAGRPLFWVDWEGSPGDSPISGNGSAEKLGGFVPLLDEFSGRGVTLYTGELVHMGGVDASSTASSSSSPCSSECLNRFIHPGMVSEEQGSSRSW